MTGLQARLKELDPSYRSAAATESKQLATVSAGSQSKFERLMAGDWDGMYESQSEADLALCGMLAQKHGCDPYKIDAEFRRSRLYRAKWERKDYRERTIRRAITHRESGGTGTAFGAGLRAAATEWRSTFKSYDELEKNWDDAVNLCKQHGAIAISQQGTVKLLRVPARLFPPPPPSKRRSAGRHRSERDKAARRAWVARKLQEPGEALGTSMTRTRRREARSFLTCSLVRAALSRRKPASVV